MLAETTGNDPLEQYDEMCVAGVAPPIDEFCARFPQHPGLARKIRILATLRRGLRSLASSASSDMRPPSEIAGFQIISLLGSGGGGSVYLARQTKLKRFCALKLFSPEVRHARIMREAELAARLEHPNIARVIGHGEEDGVMYIASELVRGASLASLLKVADLVADCADAEWIASAFLALERSGVPERDAERPLPSRVAVDVAAQIAAALRYAHDHGVLHRDIKPANVMVDFDGKVKLVDFGIAVDYGDPRLTQTGVFLGTFDYAAPEQLRGERHSLGPWTDIYALGATLYEMLTQRTPFESPSFADRLREVDAAPRYGPRELQGNTPRAVDRVVMAMLEPVPARRLRDAGEVVEHLRLRAGSNGFQLPRWFRASLSQIIAVVGVVSSLMLASSHVRLQRQVRELTLKYEAERKAADTAILQAAITAPPLSADLQRCYDSEKRPTATEHDHLQSPDLHLDVQLVVSRELVEEVRITSAYGIPDGVQSCISRALQNTFHAYGVGLDESQELMVRLTLPRSSQSDFNPP